MALPSKGDETRPISGRICIARVSSSDPGFEANAGAAASAKKIQLVDSPERLGALSSSRLALGQRDRLTEVEVAGTSAYVLGLEDVIVDRLAARMRWSSEDDCRWAKVLVGARKADLDLDYLRTQADAAGVSARLEQLLEETT